LKSALVIGGGFAGIAACHQLDLMGGWNVDLVEAAPYLGGGNKTRWLGGHPYTFGPRHFLTPKEHIYAFLNNYVPMRRCAEHEFMTYIERDQVFYSYPIHRDDIDTMPDTAQINAELSEINMAAVAKLGAAELGKLGATDVRKLNLASEAKNFEEYWIKSIGRTLYDKFVNSYSKKMWMIDDNRLIDDFTWSPKGVTIKEGPRACWDTAISGYPIAVNGYDDYFRIGTTNAKVHLGTTIEHYDIPRKAVVIGGTKRQYDVIINTISPDILFEHAYGELPYIGRDLITVVLPIEFVLPPNVYFVYYASNERFTRIVEYKKFTLHKAPTTLISLEIPSKRNKLYPLPFESEKAKAKKYFDEMPAGVFSIGRAGSYLYNVDIDDTIDHAMKVAEALKS
jgi:UDP-galactopyranose mutase